LGVIQNVTSANALRRQNEQAAVFSFSSRGPKRLSPEPRKSACVSPSSCASCRVFSSTDGECAVEELLRDLRAVHIPSSSSWAGSFWRRLIETVCAPRALLLLHSLDFISGSSGGSRRDLSCQACVRRGFLFIRAKKPSRRELSIQNSKAACARACTYT
jgi:hypothetical protein